MEPAQLHEWQAHVEAELAAAHDEVDRLQALLDAIKNAAGGNRQVPHGRPNRANAGPTARVVSVVEDTGNVGATLDDIERETRLARREIYNILHRQTKITRTLRRDNEGRYFGINQ
jgi:hypothetical protein